MNILRKYNFLFHENIIIHLDDFAPGYEYIYFILLFYVNTVERRYNESHGPSFSIRHSKMKRKVGGKRYEARSRGRSSPDTLAF